ncbi:MAG TPA: NAD(P)/FAD-dependent oxidoreductase, partial [Polyangiaceae bacterium]|nr:NAD(P)/FAD-dependent oxidoreductase [Polyangiaceae bacterium]
MTYDVLIVGGGPGGLAAALALGRARKRVLLCDGGVRRNERAEHLHNFVTRDGTPPLEFRRIGREQLLPYPSVDVRDGWIEAIGGEKGAFTFTLDGEAHQARRILLTTGMVDLLPELPGFAELWGRSIFQCPYCHGWEIQDRPFAVWLSAPEMVKFALLLRGWTSSVVALTHGAFPLDAEQRDLLARAGVPVDERPLAALIPKAPAQGPDARLERIEFSEGPPLAVEALFAKPPQRQVALVTSLGLQLGEAGFIETHAMTKETSIPGIYAAGDATTGMQGATLAAGAGVHAAAWINHELTIEL